MKTNHCRLKTRIEGSGEMIVVTGATGHIGNVLIREQVEWFREEGMLPTRS